MIGKFSRLNIAVQYKNDIIIIMPFIERVVEIKASPEKVFDLIARPEDFSEYSSLVKKVTATGDETYHWVAGIYGIEVEWDAKVVEKIKPERFAWQSIKGVENSGSYTLKPIEGGTMVIFHMEYHLPSAVLENLARVFAGGFIEKMASELLENVKDVLEKF